MDWYVKTGDVSNEIFLMNRQTLYESKNQNSIYSTKKRDGNVPNVSKI